MKLLGKIIHTYRTISWLPLIVLDKLHLINGTIIYKTKQNLDFIARAGTSDVEEIIVIISGYAYPLDVLPLIHHPIIVDLGGYIGEFSLYAYRYYKGICRVVAYEPSKDNFHFLEINVRLNKAAVAVFNQGISSYSGKGYIRTRGLSTDEFSVHFRQTFSSDERCDVITLKNIQQQIKSNIIDILKIDIEGSEYDLIFHKPTLDILHKSVRFLFIEFHECSKTKSSIVGLNRLLPFFDIIEKRDHVYVLKNKFI